MPPSVKVDVMRFLLLAFFLAVLAPPVLPAWSAPTAAGGETAGASLDSLHKRFDALRQDAKRGALRDNWLRLIEDLNRLSAQSRGNAKARTSFLAARAQEELSHRSFNAQDRIRAIDAYAAVAKNFPKHDLAPSSLYRQAYLLGAILGRTEKAAAVLAALQKNYPRSLAAKDGRALQARLSAGAEPAATRPPAAAARPPAAAAPGQGASSGRKSPVPRNRNGEPAPEDIMEQLGLTVRTIMLDPGHGGKDPGCTANKLVEADFTLDMARRIGPLLTKKGFTVLYTRTDNRFLSLPDRTEMANKKKVDLFISIHLNANPSSAVHGLETYYLNEAKTNEAAKVASRENGVSVRNISDLQFILTDVMLSAKLEESRALAQCVHKAILDSLRAGRWTASDNGVRSAPFHVLMGARMPAILLEFGYASNAREAQNLRTGAFLQRQAEGVAQGIAAYKEQLAKIAR
ncbi:MAG: N-acetylmuramoyl-L-alanine amidase [Desulfovibrio sp.]|jgi:N-acetylmuramoyl-L-alanine amidase|nr:N-acetylmuramoyl-L-alanine amidase [Desulfovibrio sp.]